MLILMEKQDKLWCCWISKFIPEIAYIAVALLNCDFKQTPRSCIFRLLLFLKRTKTWIFISGFRCFGQLQWYNFSK